MKFELHKITRANVEALQPYSSARDEYKSDGSEMVFLDANENPFENGVNRYPDPQQRDLKGVLANQKGVLSDNILLGNGSDEVLDLLFRAFCEPHVDNIITLPPTYGMYNVLSGINTVENRKVLLTDSFQPDVAQILRAVDPRTKLIFLCSPNNPTGNGFDEDRIISLLDAFDGLVVIDEAYIDFSARKSWVRRLTDYPNLVVTQTLSKAYGLAGIRLGLCIASAGIIAVLNKIKPPYNVNGLTQARALQRVLSKESVSAEVKDILRERAKLRTALQAVSFVEVLYPTEANFILVKVDDANLRYGQLLQKGIVIRNRSTQPLCENTLRFTVGTANENEKLISALKELSDA